MNESTAPILARSPTSDIPARSDTSAPLELIPPPDLAPPATQDAHHHPHGLLPAIQSLFYIIVIAIFIITFTVQPFRIPSGSMEPTLLVGDFLLVDKQALGFDEPSLVFPPTGIHRGEIIIFHYPVDPAMHLIKRVIGLPGDHLRLRDGHVYINGQPLTETYAVYRPGPADGFRDNFPRLQATAPDIDPAWWIRMHTLVDNGELIIPQDNYFVLGDNRNGSEDSRYWGFVPRSAIVGKPMFIYFSLQTGRPENPTPFTAPSPQTRVNALLNFARWNRIFQVVH
ncbi:MAG: signal peptidase [Acidobacteriaceae bacterium]|nr:signal peptidase [Acidobacteriaceae bacterium]